MSDQSAPAESGAPESAPEQSQPSGPPEWLGPITEKLEELGQTTGSMADQIAALQQPQTEEIEEDESFEGFYDDDGEITEQGARKLIGDEVDQRLQSVLSQRDAQRALEEREDAFEALRDEIPALQDDKLAARLVRDAAEYLRAHNREDVIETPMFVDLIEQRYVMELHQQRLAAEQEQEEQREVVLESASGSTARASKNDEVDWGERIVKAAQNLRPTI